MYCCDKSTSIAIVVLLLAGGAQADGGYILGLQASIDTADGRAVSGFVDYGIADSTWLSASIGRTNTGGEVVRLETLYADASIEQSFGMFGARVGAAYWGDRDILHSNDLRGSLFARGRNASVTLDFERREFDFIFEPRLAGDRGREVQFSANGIGASGWIRAGERLTVFVSGMSFDYSRDIRLTENIDVLRFLSTSRLSLLNSLIDYRISTGIDVEYGQRMFDVALGQWQAAIDGGKVTSLMLGYVTPAGPATDLEFRLAVDESENFGSTVSLAIGFYFFGD